MKKSLLKVVVFFLAMTSALASKGDSTSIRFKFWCSEDTVAAAVWYNSKVAVLIEGESPSDRDNAKMEAFLQMMTNLYNKYEEVTGLDDLPLNTPWNGRITVQIPNDNCGASGLASHGVLGISVGKSLFDEEQYNRIEDNVLQQVFFYEAHRNFWPEYFNNKFDWAMDNNSEAWGWWTVGMNNAMVSIMAPLIGVEGMYGSMPGSEFGDNMLAQLQQCIDGNYNWNTGWTHAMMPWNPGESINDLMSGLLIYSYKTWGGKDWLAGFYEGIRNVEIPDRSDVFAYQECRDNVYKIWSLAAGHNLSGYFEGTLQWPLTTAAKDWVASRLGLGSIPAMAERFAYPHLSAIHNKNGGYGWNGKWNLASANGGANVQAGSLLHEGVTASGGKLLLTPVSASPQVVLSREFDAVDSGTVWLSYLVKAADPATGHFFIRPNGNNDYGIGKGPGNAFSIGNEASSIIMMPDSTYFVVARISLKPGNDSIFIWINPSVSDEPPLETADAALSTKNIGSLTNIDINVEGPATVELDEIRISDTFESMIKGTGMVPPAPGNLEASVVSHTTVFLHWEDNSSIETGFRLQRKTTGPFVNIATLAADVTSFTDTTLSPDSTYTYRIGAVGAAGNPAFSNKVSISTSIIDAPPGASERFSYGGNTTIDAKSGGTGWITPWRLETSNGIANVQPGSLNYQGIVRVGGKLQVNPGDDTPEVLLKRDFAPIDTGTVWISYLVKPVAIGDGHFFIRPNDNQNYAIGKKWGNELAIDNQGTGKVLVPGETYLIVAKIVLQPGEDSILMWVNPSVSAEPTRNTAGTYKTNIDLGSLSTIDINVQGYGQGNYEFDELNIGRTFETVIGKGLLPNAPNDLKAAIFSATAIDLTWADNATNETGFRIYRKTTGAFGLIATVAENITAYQDTVAAAIDTIYTYRIQAFNNAGGSAFSITANAGGVTDTVTAVAERFGYAVNTSLYRKNRGIGWSGPWDVLSGDSAAKIRSGSLMATGVARSGGKLELNTTDTTRVILRRRFSPRPDGAYWLSYLVSANNTAEDGYFYVSPNGIPQYAIGKGNGAGFTIGSQSTGVPLLADSTYLVVAKIILRAGNDSIYMWVNPDVSGEPVPASAHAAQSGIDLGNIGMLEVGMQSQGACDYLLDELRLSDSFEGAVRGTGMIPEAPANLVATALSTTQISLSWEDNSDKEDRYDIYQKTDSGLIKIATLDKDATDYNIGGRWPDSTYTYRVRAINEAGLSAFSNLSSATTESASGMDNGPLGSSKKIILWISAHPDDELFGAHAAFARYIKDSLQIGHYINVTSGSVQYNPTTVADYLQGMERMGEAAASAISVGADNRFMCMIDGQVSTGISTLEERLTRAIREIQPDVIITHGPGGEYGNPDHVATSAAVTAAVASAALPGAFPGQLAEGLKVWNTPKFYRVKYDPYPSTDSLTLFISADDTSAALNKTYYHYADETLRASHQTAEAVGIFDTYPIPHSTQASLHYAREDVSAPAMESSLLTGLPDSIWRPSYVKNWVVIGSWPGSINNEVLGADEAEISDPLGETYGGQTWANYDDHGQSVVNFRRTFAENINTVAYAYTEIAAAASTTFLRMAANNKYRIWLNGSLIAEQLTISEYDYEKHIPVTLQAGTNRILVKMESSPEYAGIARPWGFFMKIGNSADSPQPVPDSIPHITVLPTETLYNMGEAIIGKGNQNTTGFVIQNTDMADSLTVNGLVLTGDNPQDYVIHDDSGQMKLAPGGKRTFSVSFNPGTGTTKARVAAITITSNDPVKPAISIRIFGDALSGEEGLTTITGNPVAVVQTTAARTEKIVQLYPNPVSSVLSVTISGKGPRPAVISIVNLNRQQQYIRKNAGDREIIDVSHYVPGVYFVIIQMGSDVIVKKIVKVD